jgi:hypothetical protein
MSYICKAVKTAGRERKLEGVGGSQFEPTEPRKKNSLKEKK